MDMSHHDISLSWEIMRKCFKNSNRDFAWVIQLQNSDVRFKTLGMQISMLYEK